MDGNRSVPRLSIDEIEQRVFDLADQIEREEGVSIEHAYHLAQMRLGLIPKDFPHVPFPDDQDLPYVDIDDDPLAGYELTGVFEEDAPKLRAIEKYVKLGTIFISPQATEALARNNVKADRLLERHIKGDWGDMLEEDKMMLDILYMYEGSLLSVYTLPDKQDIWVMTAASRILTVIIIPQEYPSRPGESPSTEEVADSLF